MIEDPPVGIYLPERSCDLVIHRKLRIRHPIRPQLQDFITAKYLTFGYQNVRASLFYRNLTAPHPATARAAKRS
jgi:hypothetical protein